MEKLGIDIKYLLAQLLNFALFYYIFKKLISKHFDKFLTDERKKEEEKENLDQLIKKTEEKRIVYEKTNQNKIEKERDQMIRQAKEQAEKIRIDMLSETEKEIARLKSKTHEELAKSRLDLERDLKKDIVSLAVDIVEKALKNYLSPQMSKELTQNIIKNSKAQNSNV